MLNKIISGGQTGADQAGLDVAIKRGIPHGGWIPKGRMTEAGPLPEKYDLQEMPVKSYPKRTEQNILDSDGTLIVSHGKLTGGSKLTVELAQRHCKPSLHLDIKANSMAYATRMVASWLADNGIRVLNVAGPRASKDPEIYGATVKLLESVLGRGAK
ncbi:putative molybdenum carrier protein [Desulfurivibrio sp. D14AmB]|uniref:putative molybdenum carrier protein n=1 Tax=Desulfurivibrio sp. D14AmB TaxID=3374370 RepID=UPI00376EAF80